MKYIKGLLVYMNITYRDMNPFLGIQGEQPNLYKMDGKYQKVEKGYKPSLVKCVPRFRGITNALINCTKE